MADSGDSEIAGCGRQRVTEQSVSRRRLKLPYLVSYQGIALATVSYTHLDVYKRQVVCLASLKECSK